MIVGVPRELKQDEYRVGLLPVGAELLVRDGHTVLMEVAAGEGSGFEDEKYLAAGAKIIDTADEIWGEADLIVKVKEPQESEILLMRNFEGLSNQEVAYVLDLDPATASKRRGVMCWK